MADFAGGRAGTLREAPLSSAFDEVWVEWLALWHSLQEGAVPETEAVRRAAEEAAILVRRLARVALARAGAAATAQVDAAQFALIALIDETLLFNTWAGQSAWQAAPLEYRLSGTRTAGEQIPDRIEALLRERDPASRDLANVYLQCLLLGFRGRLRDGAGMVQHEEWRRALFAFAWQRDPDYRRIAAVLEKPAAIQPARQQARRLLPDGFRLGLILLLIVLGMSVVGHFFWLDIAHQLKPGLYIKGADEVRP
ncbi:type VI secretion system protein ImpK [Silvimonas terrae]|uniref:Type VI secretion system protein ImpK n=1 Tax=Silvimonas terrae TaxID=300266 RepID=A0A840RE62_9NEIS|nr:DotU/TssL family secretion system protein [Silvimonas terrae]MBB5190660.1 type VI secretion system protein ImpK [Silvimonas terrae]